MRTGPIDPDPAKGINASAPDIAPARDERERRGSNEARFLEGEKRFRLVVEAAGDSFFTHDYEGRIFDVNKRVCESLGYKREELLNMNISDINLDVRNRTHRKKFWEPLVAGHYITFEGIHRRKDGSVFPVEVRLGRLDLGERRLLLSLCRDITDRKQAENRLKEAFQEIIELKNCLEKENVYLRQEIASSRKHEEIIGESHAIRSALSKAERVAKEESNVLILGETGTGKELLARAIHNMSARGRRSMIKVNCSALPPTLIESELFGREKGAFTGAVTKQVGRFEMAHGSTIFLDEIGDLPLELQAKLLRVLQERQFERIGSSETIAVDVRVIAATNQDLAQLVTEKKFRGDLYYRLNVFPVVMPPLRDRKEDIPLLVRAFIKEFEQSMGKSIKHIPQKAMDHFMRYPWPGNIRELRNAIERAMILSFNSVLQIEQLEVAKGNDSQEVNLYEVEKKHIIQILEKTGWRVSGKKGAAPLLGLKESTLRARMQKLKIKRPGH